ncbi:MAG: response regulator transcription factor [Muribaculaceae bacterium]
MEKAKRILVVDDEETLCDALAFNLESEGYEVATAYSAEEALTLDLASFDLLLLDIMMGEISGTQLARIMKANPATASVPIIFCTAKDSEEDMIKGLDLGADDYIMKPYSLKAVLARVRTVLRRTSTYASVTPAANDEVAYKGLVLSKRNRTCHVDGSEVKMPKKEFEILLKLMSNIGQVFSRAELLKEIWPDEVVVLDRVVDVNITRIRQKIGQYGKNIVTRSGYGYGFIE